MAGKKGRSGGARVGAGRKRVPVDPNAATPGSLAHAVAAIAAAVQAPKAKAKAAGVPPVPPPPPPIQDPPGPAVEVSLEPQPHGGALKRSKADVVEPEPPVQDDFEDPKEFLKAIMNSRLVEAKTRVAAARALLQYEKPGGAGALGKKEQKAEEAKTAAAGKYGVPPPPKLVVNNGP